MLFGLLDAAEEQSSRPDIHSINISDRNQLNSHDA
jgi:hypothetical protein